MMINFKNLMLKLQSDILRLSLTVISIASIIVFLIIFIALIQELLTLSLTKFENMGFNSVEITGGMVSQSQHRIGRNMPIFLSNADYAAIKLIPGIKYIAPMFETRPIVSYKNSVLNDINVMMAGADFFKIVKYPLSQGRYILPIDKDHNVAIIEKNVVKSILRGHPVLGTYIVINKIVYKIIGIIDWQDHNVNGNLNDIWISRGFNQTDFIDPTAIYFQPTQVNVVKFLKDSIIKIIANHHNLSSNDMNLVNITDNQKAINEESQYYRNIQLIVFIVGIFMLLISAFNLIGILSSVISDDFKEIELRLTLGAQYSDLYITYMMIGLIIGLSSTILGVACAWIGMKIVNSINFYLIIMDQNLHLKFPVAWTGIIFIISLITVLLATYIPLRRIKFITSYRSIA